MPFLNKGSNFAIFQEPEKLPNLIEILYSLLKRFGKTYKPSLRKQLESSSIPAALRTLVLLISFFYVDLGSMCQMKSIILNKMSIILYYRDKSICFERGWKIFRKIVTLTTFFSTKSCFNACCSDRMWTKELFLFSKVHITFKCVLTLHYFSLYVLIVNIQDT